MKKIVITSLFLLLVAQESTARTITSWIYDAETDTSLGHAIGRTDKDGWSANMGADNPGHLLYGPYASDLGTGNRTAVYRVLLDNVTTGDPVVAVIDAYDATLGEVIQSRDVLRAEFAQDWIYEDLSLEFNLNGRDGHLIETRLYWTDTSYMKVDYVEVFSAPACTGTEYVYTDGNGDEQRICYHLSPNQATWLEAVDACSENFGGVLAYIPDAGADALVKGMLTANTYIGINDRDSEGDFEWPEGSSGYTGWAAGEPNNNGGVQDCTTYSLHLDAWDDVNCTDIQEFACSMSL